MEKTRVVLVNEATKQMIVLPRNPGGFQDEQSPNYSTENTPAGALYQAMTFENGGTRDFGFRVVLLPDVDGGAQCTTVMRFVFGLCEPTWYTDPTDGVTRWEPPDVSMIYGAMVRRGKLTKRPASYALLDTWVGCRELTLDLQIRSYVRAVPPAKKVSDRAGRAGDGVPADTQNYDEFQGQNVADFLKAEGAGAVNLREDRGVGGPGIGGPM